MPTKKETFRVDSEWFNGSADIVTYEIDELMATKLRALYQRRKGRDLFDLWYVAQQELINVERVVNIFTQYCTHNGIKISGEEFMKNLDLKKMDPYFQFDMNALLPLELNWNFDVAFQYVVGNIISRLP